MANTFTDGKQLASAMIGGLIDAGVLINTIYRDPESDLVAGKGQTISVRSPKVGVASNFTGTATTSDAAENEIPIVLNQQPYEQVSITTKQRNLNIEDFYAQVIEPRVGAIAEYLEAQVATQLTATDQAVVNDATDPGKVLTSIGAALTANKVPMGDRFAACSPSFVKALLDEKALVAANVREDAGQAMQEAIIGRAYGFTVLASSHVAETNPGSLPTAIGYHRTGLAAAFRTPAAPQGGATGAAYSGYGMSARVVMDWSNSALADVITADVLAGFALVGDDPATPGTATLRVVKGTLGTAP